MSDPAVPLLDNDDTTLFPKLTERQLALLRPLGREQPIAAGEVLFRDGDLSYDPMVLLDGEVAVLDGPRELARQLPRDLMVELSVFTGQRVGATAVVRRAGAVLVVPAERFRELIGRELEFGDFVLHMLFRRRRAIARLGLGIRIVGSPTDPETVRLREFASRNRILSDWTDPAEPDLQPALQRSAAEEGGMPLVVLGGDQIIRNPTNAELAAATGLRIGPLVPRDAYDIAVVGAGPAGLAAAVYAASGGMRTAVLDAVSVGGQAATSARIENYLGFPAGISGAELAERAAVQAQKFGAEIMVPRRAVSLALRDGSHIVGLDDGHEVVARAVIVAAGIQYRRLPVPHIADYEGIGVAYATDSARRQLRAGDAAIVVGGANSAGQAALALADDGRHVHLVVRHEVLDRGMARYLRDRITLTPAIKVHLGHELRGLEGNGHLERAIIANVASGERHALVAGVVVVLIGAEPRTEWLAGAVALDAGGFVLTGAELGAEPASHDPAWDEIRGGPLALETSRPGVFAVGDVRAGATRMVAPAVGEGGMAVRLAAERLAASRPLAPKGPAMNDLTIREATPHDTEALERLARLNDHSPLHGPALVAERRAVPIAALALGNGALVTDPSEPTSAVVHALRQRRYQLLRPGAAVASHWARL